MKKLFIFVFLLSFATFAHSANREVPENIDKEIRTWVKDNYDIESFGSSAQKMMYDEEVRCYIWLKKNAKDEAIFNRVIRMYPPKQWGYSTIQMMYQEELKNKDW